MIYFLAAVVCRVLSLGQCDPRKASHCEDIKCIHRAPNNLEVVLEDGDGAREGFVSTATEQGHTRIKQDGCNKRRVWYPTQAFDAALKAS